MRLTLGIHPVREALRAGRPLDKVIIAQGSTGPRIQEIVELCRRHAIPVRFEARDALDRVSKGVSHQGVVALGAPHQYASLDEVLTGAGLLVVLDGIEDPHNLGAIVRTSHAAGASAIIVPERRSAPLTETVDRAAAGALEYLPVARVTNISRALEQMKQSGFWVYGLDERGTHLYDKVEYTRPTALVLAPKDTAFTKTSKNIAISSSASLWRVRLLPSTYRSPPASSCLSGAKAVLP